MFDLIKKIVIYLFIIQNFVYLQKYFNSGFNGLFVFYNCVSF
jgi:hypothetical protein